MVCPSGTFLRQNSAQCIINFRIGFDLDEIRTAHQGCPYERVGRRTSGKAVAVDTCNGPPIPVKVGNKDARPDDIFQATASQEPNGGLNLIKYEGHLCRRTELE